MHIVISMVIGGLVAILTRQFNDNITFSVIVGGTCGLIWFFSHLDDDD